MAEIDQRLENDALVDALRGALTEGQEGLKHVPELLRLVLEEGAWVDRYDQKGREPVQYNSFAKFVTDPPTRGIGGDIDMVRRLIADDVSLLKLFDKAIQRPAGGDRRSSDFNVDNVHIGLGRPDGNSRQRALRRLRKDRPDLLERVEAGELSPHAAMVEAGFLQKSMSVPADNMVSLAETLRRRLTSADRKRLRDLLR